MPGTMPTLVVIKKKMMMEDGAPDYSGPGYNEARRTLMLEADGGRRARIKELDEIACQLDEASQKHAAQAERIRDLADEMCRDGKKQGYDGHGG